MLVEHGQVQVQVLVQVQVQVQVHSAVVAPSLVSAQVQVQLSSIRETSPETPAAPVRI